MIRSRIVGVGHYLPENIVTNFDLEERMDTTNEWIRQRTGILQRHVADEGVGTSDLATEASKRALDAAGIPATDLDFVICCTMTSDYHFPSSACLVEHNIGAKNAGAVDINAACSGFIYGLEMADAFIRAGVHQKILVIGAEVVTSCIDWGKRDTAILFGDGAGAVVVCADESDQGIISTYTNADGEVYEMLYIPAGGSKQSITPENVHDVERGIVMDGRALYKRAIAAFGDATDETLKRADMSADDLDLFVPHQANKRIIDAAAERIGLPEEKIFLNVDKVANTSAASIPIALSHAIEQDKLHANDTVLLAGFGAGLTWGGAVVRW
jgi:3-oxoacyl-[acyl-carrier-protein] synthase-3